MTPIEAAFLSIKDRAKWLTFEAFSYWIAGAEIEPVTVDGECAGAVVVIGPEIHACVLPKAKGRWFNRRMWSVLKRVVAQHGYATTKATTEEGERFVARLGFVKQGDSSWVLKL